MSDTRRLVWEYSTEDGGRVGAAGEVKNIIVEVIVCIVVTPCFF